MAHAPCSICGSTEGPDHICPGQNAELVGQTLDGRYQIEEILGQGGMGMVFRATNLSLGKKVAVKTLHPALAASQQFFERFRREAQLAANLHHPNIIQVTDFGRVSSGPAAGTCFYVMELLTGESLKQIVKGRGALSMRRAADIIEQCARGLSHAHAQGAVHRDIKPHNIMVDVVDGRNVVKILDFGLVKAMEQEDGEQLTSTGQVLGTPQYMPPEQAGGEAVDQRSDLYSLAGVFFYCLTGSSPFGANSVRKALQAALTQTVPSVNTKREGAPVPRELDEFFRKALAREKEDRHQSAEEFIEDFEAALSVCSDEQLDALPTGTVAPERKEGGSGSGVRRKGSSPSSRTPSSVGNRPSRASQSRPSNIVVDRGAMTVSRPQGDARAPVPPPKANPAPPPRKPDGLSTGAKAALVVGPMVLLLAAAGVVMALKKDPNGGPAPLPDQGPAAMQHDEPKKVDSPKAAGPVLVKLSSTPESVEIYENDSLIGVTPMDLNLSRDGAHTLTFKRDGFVSESRKLDLSHWGSDPMEMPISLKAMAAKTPVVADKPQGGAKQAGKTEKKKDDISIFE